MIGSPLLFLWVKSDVIDLLKRKYEKDSGSEIKSRPTELTDIIMGSNQGL